MSETSRGARDHNLEPRACKPLEVGSVERQDPLRTPFARAGGDQSVIARGAGDLALAEIFDELPSFLPVKPDDSRPLPQGTFQDRESILDAEPMRTGQSSHDRVGFDQRLQREDDAARPSQERCELGGSRSMVLM